jgi:DNA polymerase-3 subunit delta'
MLRQHVTRSTLRHAYLFTGSPGLGRRSLALRFGQALNCTRPPAPGESCGACRDCRQIESMSHPDLAVIQAEQEGGTLKVNQVRELQHNLALKPYQARYRLALFLRFQEANPNAANALLKTLEEAPDYAVLILTADNTEQLLPTIVSRCEVLRLRPLPIRSVQEYLQTRGADKESARLLAHLSGGRPGYALRLLADPALLEIRKQRLDDLWTLLTTSRRKRFDYADGLSKDKDAMRQTLLIWQSYWRDVMLRTAQADTPLINLDFANEIEPLAKRLTLPLTRRLVAQLEKSIERLEMNVNSRLLAEVLLLDWPMMGKD